MTNCTCNQTDLRPYVTNFFVPWSLSFLFHIAVFTIISLAQPEVQFSEKRQSRNGMTVKLLMVSQDLVSDAAVQKMPNTKKLGNHGQQTRETGNFKKEDLFAKVADTSALLPLEDGSVKKSDEFVVKENLILNKGKESFHSAPIRINSKKSQDIDTNITFRTLNINGSSLENGKPVLLKKTKPEASTMLQEEEVLAELKDGDDNDKETLPEQSSKSLLAEELNSPMPSNLVSPQYSKTQFDQLKKLISPKNKAPMVSQEFVSSSPPHTLKLKKEKSDEFLNPAAERSVVKRTGSKKARSVTRQVKFDTKKLLDHLVPNALPKKEKVNLSVPFVRKKINEASQLQSTKQCEGLSESASTSNVNNFYAQMNTENVRVSQLLGNKFQPFSDSRVDITSLLDGSLGGRGYGQGAGAQITISYLLKQQQASQAHTSKCNN